MSTNFTFGTILYERCETHVYINLNDFDLATRASLGLGYICYNYLSATLF